MATAKPKVGKNTGNMGKGRPKGSPNKATALLKDAILKAATEAGDDQAGEDEDKGGLVAYLKKQAADNPGPFLALLGKVLPLQVNADIEGGFNIIIGGKDADCC